MIVRSYGVARFIAVCAVLITTVESAASILDFDIWMRKIEKRSQDVQRNIAKQDAGAIVADAKEIEALYQLMEDYFANEGKADDAVKFSKEGKELAASIVQSVEKNDYDTAFKAALGISQACNNCHDVYKPFK